MLCCAVCEQEGWIREKEQIFSSEDVGKDLTGALRLLSQHKALEDEMTGRSAHLQQTIRQGEELVADNHFGAEKIKERIQDIQVLLQILLRVKMVVPWELKPSKPSAPFNSSPPIPSHVLPLPLLLSSCFPLLHFLFSSSFSSTHPPAPLPCPLAGAVGVSGAPLSCPEDGSSGSLQPAPVPGRRTSNIFNTSTSSSLSSPISK